MIVEAPAIAVDWRAFVEQLYSEQKLTWLQERGFEEAYDNERRKLWLACLLAAVLGVVGGHRFYLGLRRSAVLMSAITLAGFTSAACFSIFSPDTAASMTGNFIARMILLSMCVWAALDLYRIPAMVHAFNSRLSTEIKVRLTSGFFV